MDAAGVVHRATDATRYMVDNELNWIEQTNVLHDRFEVVAVHNARTVRSIYYVEWKQSKGKR